MDNILILERIHNYNGQNVHVWTHSGKSFTGQLNVITSSEPTIHRVLEIGWRQDRVEIPTIYEISLT